MDRKTLERLSNRLLKKVDFQSMLLILRRFSVVDGEKREDGAFVTRGASHLAEHRPCDGRAVPCSTTSRHHGFR